MMLIYWTIRREIERRRNSKAAMREMRRYGYKAEWHDLAVKRHDWRRYAA